MRGSAQRPGVDRDQRTGRKKMKRRSSFATGRALAIMLIVLIGGVTTSAEAKKPTRPPPPSEPPTCDVSQPKYVLFLDDYPKGRFQLAVLPCLSDSPVDFVNPQELVLDLPRRDRRQIQDENGDVYHNGRVKRQASSF